MFRKGYKQSKQQQETMKRTRHSKYGKAICVICGDSFDKYTKKQIICPKLECHQKQAVDRYNQLKIDNPLAYRARTLSGTLRLGSNKQKIVIALLTEAVGRRCPYCDTIITIDNASIDHKIPRINSKVYNRSTKKMTYSKAELLAIDHPDNLHITCRGCNLLKSDFSHNEFLRVIKFMDDNPLLGKKLKARLNRAILVFRKFRKSA